jgi:hypothetical protein
VETATIDSLLAAEGWPRVDVIKVDVEGAEMDVLEGTHQLQRKCPELKLIIEFGPALLRNAGADPLQFLEQLAGRGFEVHCVSEKEGLLPLREVDRPSLVDRLLKDQGSLNLFCAGR